MPNSMTGFARQEVQAPWGTLSCEIRSVNHRYLEPMIRLPDALKSLEVPIRQACRQQLQRGKVEVNMQLNLSATEDAELSVNTALLEQITRASQHVVQIATQQSITVSAVDPLSLLQWPGVIEKHVVDQDDVENTAKQVFQQTLTLLIEHRQREGQELQSHIEQRLVAIGGYVVDVREQMPSILLGQQEKLQQRLNALQVDIDPERLEQEVALLANKADVEEELDRLETHIIEVRHILGQKEAIGRRLDFMMQELNREANTLSSKAVHTDTTQAAVSLKVLIEQMREQIQNIE